MKLSNVGGRPPVKFLRILKRNEFALYLPSVFLHSFFFVCVPSEILGISACFFNLRVCPTSWFNFVLPIWNRLQVGRICLHRAASMAAVTRSTASPMPRRRKVPCPDSRKNCVWSAAIEPLVTTTTPSPAKDAKVYIVWRDWFVWVCRWLIFLFFLFQIDRILPPEYNEECSLPVQIRQWLRHWHVHAAKVPRVPIEKVPHGRHAARM